WLTEMTRNKYSPQIRVLAAGQLANKDAVQASEIAVNLLNQIPANVDASELFSAFLSRREGIGALGQALSKNKIPASAAIAGRKAMQQLPYYFNRLDEITVLRA